MKSRAAQSIQSNIEHMYNAATLRSVPLQSGVFCAFCSGVFRVTLVCSALFALACSASLWCVLRFLFWCVPRHSGVFCAFCSALFVLVCAVTVCAVTVCAVTVCAVTVCAVTVCAVTVCAVTVCAVTVCAVTVCAVTVCSVTVCAVLVCAVTVCSVTVCAVLVCAVWLFFLVLRCSGVWAVDVPCTEPLCWVENVVLAC